jgi:hypothetical protein
VDIVVVFGEDRLTLGDKPIFTLAINPDPLIGFNRQPLPVARALVRFVLLGDNPRLFEDLQYFSTVKPGINWASLNGLAVIGRLKILYHALSLSVDLCP